MLTAGFKLDKCRGFTLVEIVMALLILGILAGVGLPSLRDFIERNRIKTSAESLQNAIQLARGEALRLNQKVRFTLGVGTAWSVNVDAGGAVVQQSRASGEGGSADVGSATNPAGATQITFNGLGRVVDNTTPGLATLTAIDVSIAGAPVETIRRIEISSPGGQVRICIPPPTIPVAGIDPRRCLQ